MSAQDCLHNCCKKRFKGIENFFRKMAFNLGNSPSQTEVKIISCIPIDVTDLQQKIADLEMQLKETKASKPKEVSQALYTTIEKPNIFERKPLYVPYNIEKSVHYNMKIPNINCNDYPNTTNSIDQSPAAEIESISVATNSDLKEKNNFAKRCRKELSPRKFFTKKKLRKNKPAIYYAHTELTNPFNRHDICNVKEKMDKSYLGHIVRKQYIPTLATRESSITSQFSTPVCRDTAPFCRKAVGEESDMCSCCHGPFHNIDDQLISPNYYSKQGYYDSTLYDVIPVKEKSTKIKEETPKRKEHRKYVDIECWPEPVKARTKARPITVNYNTVAQLKENRTKIINSKRNKKDIVLKRMAAMKPLITCSPTTTKTSNDSSKVCTVDVSEIYARKRKINEKSIQLNSTTVQSNSTEQTPKENDISCSTKLIGNFEGESKTEPAPENKIKSTPPPLVPLDAKAVPSTEEDKTATTLKQIKSILQSVLAEVKTNSSLSSKNNNDHKKDAIVQNGPSQSNIMEGSRLLHSYTYSPYNMDPFLATCSRQLTPNPMYYNSLATTQPNCLQNYSLFMQPAPLYTTCYSNNCSVSPPIPSKPAASASTNTDNCISPTRSKETERLIKEIYNSIGLNEIDRPKTQIDCNLYNAAPKPDTKVMYTTNGVAELFKTTKTLETSFTPKTSNELSKETSFNTEQSVANLRQRHTESTSTARETIEEKVSEEEESEEEDEDSDSESTLTETEYVDVVEKSRTENKQKKGIFSRMLKLFQSKPARKIKSERESMYDSDVTETGSEETVFTKIPPQVLKPTLKFERRSKMSIAKSKQINKTDKLIAKKPYLEQEYRRYWDENIMFQNRIGKYSSEGSRITDKPYYQTIEARRVEIDHDNSPKITKVNNISPPKGLSWLKKQNFLKCGEQWKRLVLDN